MRQAQAGSNESRSASAFELVLLAVVAALLIAGGIAWTQEAAVADMLWAAAACAALVPAVLWVAADMRHGSWGADLLAVLALGSTVAVGEYLAGAVVAVMVATGRLLDSIARKRARRDLSALLERSPQQSHRSRGDVLETVAVDQLAAGDRIVVFSGELVPVDATLLGAGVFDESVLTGEAALVSRSAGSPVRSGVVNAGAAVDLEARASAADSTYSGVVRLAEQAAASAAPIARLADRAAVWFLPTALLMAAVAWAVSGDPDRAVAVLVTATPCPLLLAVPIAVTGGMSRMSRSGVVVKDGAALELLGKATTLAMDKTGTVTMGQPQVTDVVCAPGRTARQALSDAVGVEQYSPHVLASAVQRAAKQAGIIPPNAEDVVEEVGSGARGRVEGRTVRVGKLDAQRSLPDWARAVQSRSRLDLANTLWVETDGELEAALLVRDQIRPDAARAIRRLREAGLCTIIMLTGDRADNADEVARMLGLDFVQASASPADKIARILAEHEHAVTIMVGDGVNDAPALAAADVGVALGSRGSTAAAQAADAVILDDRIDRLAEAVEIARRTRRLAVQSAGVGMALSLLAMLASACGWLVPLAGAVVQEGIDLVVILNALRALGDPRRSWRAQPDAMLRRFSGEHEVLQTTRAAVRHAADSLAQGAGPQADAAVRHAHRLLVEELLPHEAAEETRLYPALVPVLGSPEATVTMSRAHAEIERLVRRLGRHLAEAPEQIRTEQVDDLRATLYGLDAILTLHFAQEEEAYFTLAAPERATGQQSGMEAEESQREHVVLDQSGRAGPG